VALSAQQTLHTEVLQHLGADGGLKHAVEPARHDMEPGAAEVEGSRRNDKVDVGLEIDEVAGELENGHTSRAHGLVRKGLHDFA